MVVSIMGRFTPLQSDVLNLGGVVCGVPEDLVSDDDRLEGMQRALSSLRSGTNVDFGYDIARWHAFLQESETHREEYTFDYAWNSVRDVISRLATDKDRQRLVEILTASQF